MKTGVSVEAHYRQLEKSGIDTSSMLPQIPELMAYLFDVFNDISRTRNSNGSGPNSISYQEILAWQSLYVMKLKGWEIDVLLAIDHLWLVSVKKK